MLKKTLAVGLTAVLLVFSITLAFAADGDAFSSAVRGHMDGKKNEVLRKTTPRVVLSAGAGGALGYGLSRAFDATVPHAKGWTAIGAVGGAVAGLIWDKKANRRNDAAAGTQAAILRDRGDELRAEKPLESVHHPHHDQVFPLTPTLIATQYGDIADILARGRGVQQDLREGSGISDAKIGALSRQRMYLMGRVADQHQAMLDVGLGIAQDQWKGGPLTDRNNRAQSPLEGRL